MTNGRVVLATLTGALLSCALIVSGGVRAAEAISTDTSSVQVEQGVQQDQASDTDDNRVEVMVWTVFASALALSIGLLLFLLRLIMGRVKTPPLPQEEHH